MRACSANRHIRDTCAVPGFSRKYLFLFELQTVSDTLRYISIHAHPVGKGASFASFLSALFSPDPPTLEPHSEPQAVEPSPDNWRIELTDGEQNLLPPGWHPPDDWVHTVLAARRCFGGELVAVRPGVTPDALPPDWRERYEERAAIREFNGRQPRVVAEREALREMVALMKRG